MKSSGSSWLTIVISAVVGVLLIVWHSRIDVLQWIIIALGILLLVPGIYTLIASLASRKRRQEGESLSISSIVASIGASALGLWMVVDPTFFVGLAVYLFAAILVVYGILQFINVVYWSRPYMLPLWFYIIPVLSIIAGVVILFTSVRTMNSVVVLVTGITLVASAINWALEFTVTHPAHRSEA